MAGAVDRERCAVTKASVPFPPSPNAVRNDLQQLATACPVPAFDAPLSNRTEHAP